MEAQGCGRCNQSRAEASIEHMKLKVSLKTIRLGAILLVAGLTNLATGCAERRVEYVPIYEYQPGHPAVGVSAASSASTNGQASAGSTNMTSATVIGAQAQPPPQVADLA